MCLLRMNSLISKSRSMERLKQTLSILSARNCRQFNTIQQGSKYSPSFKKYLTLQNGEVGSFFHDVPLDLDEREKTVTMIVEVPRWTTGKFEISKELKFNPIIQDRKNGKLRFVNNIFPYHGYIHNYGAIPQTWEDPTIEHELGDGDAALKGDNDPLDCCEIGSDVLEMGTIRKVKVLGSLALIDDGELDWKIIVIDINDPLSSELNNLENVEKYFPGILGATREWFRKYKVPAGKSLNKFAYGEQYMDSNSTIHTIKECHNSWQKFLSGSLQNKYDSLPNTERAGKGVTLEDSGKPPSQIPPEVQKWYYI
ncbi:ppa2p [Saccharomyces arboricola H-6]|uniref:inorganic diphosphatase n=1 Tax=Saccharomyces arboricola (strain H-6 / AS 2.3317 / CBS 10644) TaxID=1160507 RepID=J8Q6A8_SACAR|nr:ppa2p [Saccharomyces arboricola H-6]